MSIQLAHDEDQVPLLQALDAIPHDAIDDGNVYVIAYGQLCMRAAERIRLLEAKLREHGLTL